MLRFAVHLLPCYANNTSFKLQDGWSRNELTLCIFDSGYWWSTSLRLSRHKGLFVPDFAVSLPCALLVAFCFLLPHLLPWKRSTLKARLFNSPSFLFLLPHNFFFFILPQYVPPVPPPPPPFPMQSPASMPQPCLSCSRFSFCWQVLIGLKWVTSSITESFKPSLNVSVSWGSGGIVVLSFPPSGSPPDRRRNPRPDGEAKVWPRGKSVGLCQHSLQCTQRPQDQ